MGKQRLPSEVVGSDWMRFWAKVNKTKTCWLWTAGRTNGGYPVFSMRHRNVPAHRWLYAQEVGPIPEGLDLDHLCRVRHCVRSSHLEPVTRLENLHRSPLNAKHRTHCPQGHAYNEANTDYLKGGIGRRCRTCHRDRELIRKREKRAMKPKQPRKQRVLKPPKDCAMASCDRNAVARGWCGTHYQQWRRGVKA